MPRVKSNLKPFDNKIMSRDLFYSDQLFAFAGRTPRTRDIAIFCASELIWLLGGFAIGHSYPQVITIIPIVCLPWGIALLLSEWIKRPRPFERQGTKPLIHLFVNTPSFPSSHSTLAFALTAAFLQDVTIWPFLFVGATLVALGRVAVGVHHLSDVLAGAGLGLGIGLIVRLFQSMLV